MMQEKMTVHKALSELKVLDARINKEIAGSVFVTTNKHSNSKISGAPVKDFVDRAREKYQSIRTLINRRNAIKRAVTRSNAVTMVRIGGHDYSVAEAIDMKNVGTDYLDMLKNTIDQQVARCKAVADNENGKKLDDRVEQYVKSITDGPDTKNLPDNVKRMREDFIISQTVELVDPIGAEKVVDELQDAIDAFTSDVDSALSVSNAQTEIVVEYETF